MLVNGQWVEALAGGHIDVINPADESVLATVSHAAVQMPIVPLPQLSKPFQAGAKPPLTTERNCSRKRPN